MFILTLRTDKPEAEIGVFDAEKPLAYATWQAHRELAETLHAKLEELLEKAGTALDKIQGLVVYQGPGSFTGLRIGLSVANALADSFGVPIVGVAGENWIEQGRQRLYGAENDKLVTPEYGAPPHTTTPKH
jgi:tRNA threonylcarbamoyladenosine biosynthesis protein TsaB